jgi:Core-2/I-Branching enzyme
MRSTLFLVTFVQCFIVTIYSTLPLSNVCLAADTSDSSSNEGDDDFDRRKAMLDQNNYAKRYNNTVLDELFRTQTCPSRCASRQEGLFREEKPSRDYRTNSNIRYLNNINSISRPTRIFYLILIHNRRTANDALYLFRAIRDPNNIILIHFDQKVKHLLDHYPLHKDLSTKASINQTPESLSGTSADLSLLQEIESCSCGSRVRVESIYSVEWSKWSMNFPTLWGMEVATSEEYIHEWDVFINLSGDTIPVYTVDTMAHVLRNLKYNFVTSRSCETGLLPTNVYTFPKFWHKRRHYTRDETELDPILTFTVTDAGLHTTKSNNDDKYVDLQRQKKIQVHFGSQWVILQHSFVVWLSNRLRDDTSWPSQFRTYLQASNKLMTDETFIPTILMHVNVEDDGIDPMLPRIHPTEEVLLFPNGTSSSIYHVRFERMDEHYPSSFGLFPEVQRYRVPESLVQQEILDQPKVWGPYFLGVYDLGHIRDSGSLFARKVSALLDANMVQLLPVDDATDIPPVHWPVEVSISDRPDWSAEKRLWYNMHGKEQEVSMSEGENSENEDEL